MAEPLPATGPATTALFELLRKVYETPDCEDPTVIVEVPLVQKLAGDALTAWSLIVITVAEAAVRVEETHPVVVFLA